MFADISEHMVASAEDRLPLGVPQATKKKKIITLQKVGPCPLFRHIFHDAHRICVVRMACKGVMPSASDSAHQGPGPSGALFAQTCPNENPSLD